MKETNKTEIKKKREKKKKVSVKSWLYSHTVTILPTVTSVATLWTVFRTWLFAALFHKPLPVPYHNCVLHSDSDSTVSRCNFLQLSSYVQYQLTVTCYWNARK